MIQIEKVPYESRGLFLYSLPCVFYENIVKYCDVRLYTIMQ